VDTLRVGGPGGARHPARGGTRETICTRKRSIDGSWKLEFDLKDGGRTEAAFFTVVGRHRPHVVCVSTQVGCAVGCPFCAATATGFLRNLSDDEMFLQIDAALAAVDREAILDEGFEVSFMGMGEPLANLESVVSTIAMIRERLPLVTRVSVSTSGPSKRVDRLRELAPVEPLVHLQVSLHATLDDVRRRLVPNVRDSIEDLLDAAKRYFLTTRDPVCLNYILLSGINDSEADADRLAGVDPDAFYVKITQLNDVPNLPPDLSSPGTRRMAEFARRVEANGVATKLFVGDGLDVAASCGQLAAVQRSAPGTRT
jgi:23S rRNA (adenine2503-C2)-methyltransferase